MSDLPQQIFFVAVSRKPSDDWHIINGFCYLARADAVERIRISQQDDARYAEDNTYRIVSYSFAACDPETFYQDLPAKFAAERLRRAAADEAHERAELARLQQKYGA